MIIPKSKIATPAAMVLKFGLKNKTIANRIKNTKKNNFLIIEYFHTYGLNKRIKLLLNLL
jgi:hypothetical protein